MDSLSDLRLLLNQKQTNPYTAPGFVPGRESSPVVCCRRADVMVIAVAFGIAVIASLSSVMIPSLNALLRPRFGISLTLLMGPLQFLCLFLWKPSPRALWVATVVTFLVAIIGGGTIWLNGTVDTVSNHFTDRLHSAYLYSVLPATVIALYLACVSWRIRHQIPATERQG